MFKLHSTFVIALVISGVAHAAALGVVMSYRPPVPREEALIIDVAFEPFGGEISETGSVTPAAIEPPPQPPEPVPEKMTATDGEVQSADLKKPPVKNETAKVSRKQIPVPRVEKKTQPDKQIDQLQVTSDSSSPSSTAVSGEAVSKGAVRGSAPRVFDAKLLGINPVYPRYARLHNQEGRVVFRVQVAPDGHLIEQSVVSSSGSPVLDDAALRALQDAIFDTAKYGQVRDATIAFTFRLEK